MYSKNRSFFVVEAIDAMGAITEWVKARNLKKVWKRAVRKCSSRSKDGLLMKRRGERDSKRLRLSTRTVSQPGNEVAVYLANHA